MVVRHRHGRRHHHLMLLLLLLVLCASAAAVWALRVRLPLHLECLQLREECRVERSRSLPEFASLRGRRRGRWRRMLSVLQLRA